MSLDIIERMFAHMQWADERLIALVERDRAAAAAAMPVLSHLVASERVWLLRLRGEDSSTQPIWPTLSREALGAMAAENHASYARLLSTVPADGLAVEIAYTNQHGRSYRTRVDDVLMHVAMHGSYHRGQIAAAVRAAGSEPVNTDYITYVRESAGSTTS